LGGYSGGGIVALEMSRQAEAVGDHVDLVVMFDTFRPGEPPPTSTRKVRNLARNLKNYGTAGTVDWMKDVARNRLARLGIAEGQAPPENVGLYYEFQDTVLKYRYTSYPTDVFLLRAAPERPTLSFNYSWPEVTGRVREHYISGDHHTLFAKEHAGELAALVGNALDAAD
jgi:thioesterase domain-containing protein